MTVLTKPSMVIRKTDAMRDPQVLGALCEEKINIHDPATFEYEPAKKISLNAFTSSFVIMVGIIGLTCGMVIYKHYLKDNNSLLYQGFCNVPIDIKDFYERSFEDAQNIETTEAPDTKPTHEDGWGTLEWYNDPDNSGFGAALATELSLHEEFDIGQTMEKIKVKNKDRTITYIHDFDTNLTGIVDTDRCFLMPLDGSSLLVPDVFVVSIEKKDLFDLSLVRSTLTAALPALRQVFDRSLFGHSCDHKPVYHLTKQAGAIRKRSAAMPPADYVHFAGKGIQEVEISNMADLLDSEKKQA